MIVYRPALRKQGNAAKKVIDTNIHVNLPADPRRMTITCHETGPFRSIPENLITPKWFVGNSNFPHGKCAKEFIGRFAKYFHSVFVDSTRSY